MEKIYDVVIIGSGPAGLAAAIYASRARLESIIIEKEPVSGGQIINTSEVDNYPGLPGVSGYDLGEKMRAHAIKCGAEFLEDEVVEILDEGNQKVVVLKNSQLKTKCILAANGATHRKLMVPGEEEFLGNGVSYCATCDGAFYKNLTAAVVGGGDVAVEDALFLSRICKKVYLIHRRNELRAAKVLQENLFHTDNVEVIWNSTVAEIKGEDGVNEAIIKNVKTNVTFDLNIDGIFIAVGIIPNSDLLKNLVETDEGGYIKAGEDCRTSAMGIYAAGDIRTKPLRQVITAAADGAVAIESIQEDLLKKL